MTRPKSLYLASVSLCLLAGAASFGINCWTAIHSPYELDYGEGIIIWQAEHVQRLAEAYSRLDHYPYIVFHYTPLYHYAARFVNGFTHDMLSAGRWVSFLAAVLTGLVLALQTWWLIPWRFERQLRTGGALIAGLLCYNLNTMQWARLMRVDLLGLFLTFAGLFFFLLALKRRGYDYAAFVLFVLALFTKQTLIAAPAACLAITAFTDRRRAVRLLLFCTVLASLGMAALVVPTHGNVLLNLFMYNRNPFSVINMVVMFQENLTAMGALAALGVAMPVAAGSWLMRRRPAAISRARQWMRTSRARRGVALCSLHLVLALLVSLTCGKRGSNYNYFLEWNLACCVPAALIAVSVLRRVKVRNLPVVDAAVLLSICVMASGGVGALAQAIRPKKASAYERDTQEVTEAIRNIRGPVYSENMTVLRKAGKEIPAEPAIITLLAQTGGWDQRDFLSRISSGSFGAIVVTSSLDNRNRFSTEVQAAIEKAYAPDRVFGTYKLYVPKANARQP